METTEQLLRETAQYRNRLSRTIGERTEDDNVSLSGYAHVTTGAGSGLANYCAETNVARAVAKTPPVKRKSPQKQPYRATDGKRFATAEAGIEYCQANGQKLFVSGLRHPVWHPNHRPWTEVPRWRGRRR